MFNRAVAGVAVASAMLLGASAAMADTFRFGHVYEPDSIFHEWSEWAADEIAERTDGRHTVEVFPAGSLGNENDIFQGLSLGTVDMTLSGSFYASGIHGPMALASAPFLYTDLDHWRRMRDSDFYSGIREEYEAASGNHVLGLMYYGARHLTANREIDTPEDMEGLKIRVPNAPMYMLFPRSVNANATPIDFAEVYLALQQGVVDAQENPLPTILAKRFYEVQSHIMLTGHLMDSLIFQVSDTAWSGLSDEDREIFADVFSEMAENVTQAVAASEAELATRMAEEFGVTVVEVDREPFREAMMPLLREDGLPWTAEQIDTVAGL
jgi:tripartite ATP-independent transporter DctP family solute receptor